MTRLLALVALLGLLFGAGPGRGAPPPDPVRQQAEALVAFFNGKGAATAQFAPAFLEQVPEAQVVAVARQLREQLGPARAIASFRSEGPNAATVDFTFERGTATMRLVVAPSPPHLVTGLLVTASRLTGDSLDKLAADFRALPGVSGFAVTRLDNGGAVSLAQHNPDRALAIGSAFKLYVLAELVRAIGAGERRWEDVAPLTGRSLPSGILQDWPSGAPLTLHSLAALMISRSDNSATDTLIDLLGREKIEATMAATGHSQPARNRPFLKTGELFLLKGRGGKRLLAQWLAASPDARRDLLAGTLAKLDRSSFDYGSFTGPPEAIGTVEWFASPTDLVRVLDWLRRQQGTAGETARAILAINPGIGTAAAAEHAYLGFKGGSEAGVVNMSFLVRSKAGAWYAVTGSWNDPTKAIDEGRFVGLMSRAVALTEK